MNALRDKPEPQKTPVKNAGNYHPALQEIIDNAPAPLNDDAPALADVDDTDDDLQTDDDTDVLQRPGVVTIVIAVVLASGAVLAYLRLRNTPETPDTDNESNYPPPFANNDEYTQFVTELESQGQI